MWDSSCCSFSNAWLANILEWICWKYSGTYGHSPFSPSWQTSMSKHMHARYPTHPTHITPANKHLFNPASLIALFKTNWEFEEFIQSAFVSLVFLFFESHPLNFSSFSWAPIFTNTSLGLVVYYFLGGWDSKWYFQKKTNNSKPTTGKQHHLPIESLWHSITHRIHVWYIYLHLVGFSGKCRWI